MSINNLRNAEQNMLSVSRSRNMLHLEQMLEPQTRKKKTPAQRAKIKARRKQR